MQARTVRTAVRTVRALAAPFHQFLIPSHPLTRRTPLVQILPASEYSLEDLAALWNQAYAGYFVPLEYTAARLQRHLTAGDIALEHSVVLSDRGGPVALSLLGVRGDRGWIGGFGVAPAHRGRGVATALMLAHTEVIGRLALRTVQLEVMVQNWARRVYEHAGFTITRRLSVFAGPVADIPAPRICQVPVEVALAALAEAPRESAPCWQREAASLAATPRAALRAFLLRDSASETGVLLCEPSAGSPLRILDVAGSERAVASLLAHATRVLAAREILLVNEPETTAAHRLLSRVGCPEVNAQWEMHRPMAGRRA